MYWVRTCITFNSVCHLTGYIDEEQEVKENKGKRQNEICPAEFVDDNSTYNYDHLIYTDRLLKTQHLANNLIFIFVRVNKVIIFIVC